MADAAEPAAHIAQSDHAFDWRSNVPHHQAQEKMAQIPGYYEWVLDLFGGCPPGPIADAGAGTGHVGAMLSDRSDHTVHLLEGGEENLAALRARFADRPDVAVVECDLERCADSLRHRGVVSIICLDVLEHLPDDAAVLRQFREALPPGGKAYVKVPALQWLYGPVDEASGHYRRYSRKSLRSAMTAAGFTVETCRYMNFVGVVPYLIKSRVLRRRSNFSRTFSSEQLARIERMMPAIRLIDRLTGPVLGLSVVAVARA
jgi:2-polyprenyl-3-methyl-5-hydroxy-6-metoxy-1,4-benzoquinol methylase